MKIRNNKNFNVVLMAQHTMVVNQNGERANGGAPARLVLVAGAMLELDDDKWAPFADAAESSLGTGAFTMVTAPELSEEEAEAAKEAEIAAAKAVLEDLDPIDDEDIEKAEDETAKELEEAEDKLAADKLAAEKKAATAKKSAATKAKNKAKSK